MMTKEKQNTNKIKSIVIENIRAVLIVMVVGITVATTFTAATPPGLPTNTLGQGITGARNRNITPTSQWPTPTIRPRPRIGIVVGHWGDNNDPGAVCPDGLTELKINQDVAGLVQQTLNSEGFQVDLLKEFDPNLNNYQALVLVSIHADSCVYINPQATGYKVAAALNTPRPEKTSRLLACLRSRYSSTTGLSVHPGVTNDMSSYHAFDEINPETPAVIIETGFMNLDRQILTQHPDLIAEGISNGILCYIYNENISVDPVDENGE
jgi:N-acetylmuramoyl-L-alanine amidase